MSYVLVTQISHHPKLYGAKKTELYALGGCHMLWCDNQGFPLLDCDQPERHVEKTNQIFQKFLGLKISEARN